MAEFCKQCAEDLDFEPDFTNMFSEGHVPDGETGYPVLCEDCGNAFIIDNAGTCGSPYCDKKHGVKDGN